MLRHKITAAILLSCVLALSLTSCSDSEADTDTETEASTTSSQDNGTASDTAQSSTDTAAEELVFTSPEIGGNAVLSKAALDGWTASLEITGITHLPEDEDDMYSGEAAYLKITTNDGGTITYPVEGGTPGAGLWADCAENSTQIFSLGDGEYLIMQYISYSKTKDVYQAVFYLASLSGCEMHGSLNVSDSFYYKGDGIFADERLGYELDAYSWEIIYYDSYSDEPVFGEIEVGGDAILSSDTLGDLTATLEIIDIKSFPNDQNNYYTAKSIYVRLTDSNGNTATAGIHSGLTNLEINGVWADCTENAVKLFETEQNGEKKYILMVYVSHNSEEDTYHVNFFTCDLSAAEGGELRPYSIKLTPYIVDTNSMEVSPQFEYKEGTTFTDPVLGFDIEFDTENYKAVVTEL